MGGIAVNFVRENLGQFFSGGKDGSDQTAAAEEVIRNLLIRKKGKNGKFWSNHHQTNDAEEEEEDDEEVALVGPEKWAKITENVGNWRKKKRLKIMKNWEKKLEKWMIGKSVKFLKICQRKIL